MDNSFGGARPCGGKWLDQKRSLRVGYIPKQGKRGTRPIVFKAETRESGDGAECKECGRRLQILTTHLIHKHGMTPKEYREKHGPGSPILCSEQVQHIQGVARANGAAAHDNNKRTCSECGTVFQCGYGGVRTKGDAHTCSDACTAVRFSRDRSGSVPVAATYSPARKQYLTEVSKQSRLARTINCVVCAKEFECPSLAHGEGRRSKLRGVCSLACRSALKARERA